MPKDLLRARGSSAIPMTPFDETDAIDVPALRREIEFILEAGAASICVPVMVSEFDTLSEKERKLMVEVTCDVVAGRRLPTMIQNAGIPGVQLSAGQIAQLTQEIPGVTWVKQEVPPGPQGITEVVQACGEGLVGVMSGFGAQYSPTDIARGVTATIHACEVCDVVQRVWDLFDAGKEDEGRALHYAILPALQLESLMGMLFAKEVMVRRGVFERKHVRLRTRTRPLHPMDLQEIDRVWERTRSLLKF